jgi:hypothetical protein
MRADTPQSGVLAQMGHLRSDKGPLAATARAEAFMRVAALRTVIRAL